MRDSASGIQLERAAELFGEAGARRVLVVGDAMLDRYLSGTVERISPEAPVPVVRVAGERTCVGGAANVAAGVVSLGADCRLVAAVGEDPASSELRSLLSSLGVDGAGLVSDPTRPTTEKTRVLARHQQMLRLDREATSGLAAEAAERVAGEALEALRIADALVLQDYDKGTITPRLAAVLLSEARSRGIPSVVDPKLRHFFDYPGAFVFKPNVRELGAALGLEAAPRAEEELRPLLARLRCDHLILTLGEEGMLVLSEGDGGILHIPSRAREVFDVTGAGDTVVAVLAVALAGGASVVEAATLANHAAGIEVSRLGAVPVTRDDLLDELEAG